MGFPLCQVTSIYYAKEIMAHRGVVCIWNQMLGKQVASIRHLAKVKAIPTYYKNQVIAWLMRHNFHSPI
jgi:hypothetical protein